MVISINVTIYRTNIQPQGFQSSHFVTGEQNQGAMSRIMNIVETFGPTAATIGGGFFVGFLIGYALKKVIKIVACDGWIILSWISIFPN